MKLADYRSDTLRFSVSLLLISIVILSNLGFYNSAQRVIQSEDGVAYYSDQKGTISGVIFDNCQEIPSCSLHCENTIEKSFENSNLIGFVATLQTDPASLVKNRYSSFERSKNSQSSHIARYLKNCAIKIPFHLI